MPKTMADSTSPFQAREARAFPPAPYRSGNRDLSF